MTTRRNRASTPGPSVSALLAWRGYDPAASGDHAAEPAFSAAVLTGAGTARAVTPRHGRHSVAGGTAANRSRPVGGVRARHVTAGVVLVCGSVLAAGVTTTDGTPGAHDDMAAPEVTPGQPAQAALPAAGGSVATAAVSSPVGTAPAAETAPVPLSRTLSPTSPQAAVGSGPALPAPSSGAAPGGAAAGGSADGVAAASGSTSNEPESSGASAPPPGGTGDEQRPSRDEEPRPPVEQAPEPFEQVTEPVRRVAEPLTQRVSEPVEQVTEPVRRVAEPLEDAGQPAMSMLEQFLP